MLREKQYILRQMNVGSDLLLVAAAFFVAHLLRTVISMYWLGLIPPCGIVYFLGCCGGAVVVVAGDYNGHYCPSGSADAWA